MHKFWDDLINRMYTSSKKLYDVNVMVLTKWSAGPVLKYFGYTKDCEEIINIHLYENAGGVFLSIGIGDNEYNSELDMKPKKILTELHPSDSLLEDILTTEYGWKIETFSTICD